MIKLYIDNHRDIKITKVKSYALFFKYAQGSYLLHENSEGGSVTLYHRALDKQGQYKLTAIASAYSVSVSNFLRERKGIQSGSRSCVYTQLDTQFLLFKLTQVGLVTSDYCDFFVQKRTELGVLLEQKRELDELISKHISTEYLWKESQGICVW